jgi:hypothetical protein
MNEPRKRLRDLSIQERTELALRLLSEQVVDQRTRLHYWRDLTRQPAQIDTGYVAQHLVSLVTGIEGSGMRGKGEDLADGSEVKGANFLDALDSRGAIAPRWNFMANDVPAMRDVLGGPAIYLVSLDLNPQHRFRARVWKLDPTLHQPFRDRYVEWMEKLGKPKLKDPDRPYANFQLFPPRLETDENFARHGNGRDFQRLRIELEHPPMSNKIFHAAQNANGELSLVYVSR